LSLTENTEGAEGKKHEIEGEDDDARPEPDEGSTRMINSGYLLH
jgi:hypothetical protein